MVNFCSTIYRNQELHNSSVAGLYKQKAQANLHDNKSKVAKQNQEAFFKNAGRTDKAFSQAESAAEKSPSVKKKVPDFIENLTLQIFSHLCSLADRVKRADIAFVGKLDEKSFASRLKNKNYSHPSLFQEKDRTNSEKNLNTPKLKTTYSQKIGSFQNENGFYENEEEEVKSSRSTVYNILSIATTLFLGWELYDPKKDQRPIKICADEIEKDEVTWKLFKNNYSDFFQVRMDNIFTQAKDLIEFRKRNEKIDLFLRITLYATLIISGVGKLVKNNTVAIAGLAASSLTLMIMIGNYALNSFKQSEYGTSLKSSAENIYTKIAIHRI